MNAEKDELAQWVWRHTMGGNYCLHHTWEGADQDYWRAVAHGAAVAAAADTEHRSSAGANIRRGNDGGWLPAEPLGWMEEHGPIHRALLWTLGKSHCGKRGRRARRALAYRRGLYQPCRSKCDAFETGCPCRVIPTTPEVRP